MFSSPSPAAQMVEKATNELLESPDWSLNMAICDQANTTSGQVKYMLKAAKKRLGSKNPRVQLLTLTLLEAMVKNCGPFVHAQLVERDVLSEMTKMVKKRGCNSEVQQRILRLLDVWQEAFGGPGGKPPQYYHAYNELLRAGFTYPPRDAGVEVPVFTPPQTQPIDHSAYESHYAYHQGGAGEDVPASVLSALAEDTTVAPLSTMADLATARSTTELFSQMLTARSDRLRAADTASVHDDDEVLEQLASQCRVLQQSLSSALGTSSDEEFLMEGLKVNEELQDALDRHDVIKQQMQSATTPGIQTTSDAPASVASAAVPAAAATAAATAAVAAASTGTTFDFFADAAVPAAPAVSQPSSSGVGGGGAGGGGGGVGTQTQPKAQALGALIWFDDDDEDDSGGLTDNRLKNNAAAAGAGGLHTATVSTAATSSSPQPPAPAAAAAATASTSSSSQGLFSAPQSAAQEQALALTPWETFDSGAGSAATANASDPFAALPPVQPLGGASAASITTSSAAPFAAAGQGHGFGGAGGLGQWPQPSQQQQQQSGLSSLGHGGMATAQSGMQHQPYVASWARGGGSISTGADTGGLGASSNVASAMAPLGLGSQAGAGSMGAMSGAMVPLGYSAAPYSSLSAPSNQFFGNTTPSLPVPPALQRQQQQQQLGQAQPAPAPTNPSLSAAQQALLFGSSAGSSLSPGSTVAPLSGSTGAASGPYLDSLYGSQPGFGSTFSPAQQQQQQQQQQYQQLLAQTQGLSLMGQGQPWNTSGAGYPSAMGMGAGMVPGTGGFAGGMPSHYGPAGFGPPASAAAAYQQQAYQYPR